MPTFFSGRGDFSETEKSASAGVPRSGGNRHRNRGESRDFGALRACQMREKTVAEEGPRMFGRHNLDALLTCALLVALLPQHLVLLMFKLLVLVLDLLEHNMISVFCQPPKRG